MEFRRPDVPFGSRLCENSLEPRTRRIVFSIAFSQEKAPVQSVPTTTKPRQKFYAQLQSRSFHTAWVKSDVFDPVPVTSGLPRTTDIIRPARHVANVPKADVPHFHSEAAHRSGVYDALHDADPPRRSRARQGAAIALGRLRGGQGELKYGTGRFIRLCPQPAPMGVDDRPANRQPHPHAAGLRGVKRLENAIEMC